MEKYNYDRVFQRLTIIFSVAAGYDEIIKR